MSIKEDIEKLLDEDLCDIDLEDVEDLLKEQIMKQLSGLEIVFDKSYQNDE